MTTDVPDVIRWSELQHLFNSMGINLTNCYRITLGQTLIGISHFEYDTDRPSLLTTWVPIIFDVPDISTDVPIDYHVPAEEEKA